MEMNYRQMVEHAKKAGMTTEKTMWDSIDSFSELLEELKESHPQMYWDFMRKQHGLMYHGHYDEGFAMYDVSKLHYTSRTGDKRQGAYWTVDQIEAATAGMKFPAGTNKWDKFVAFNAAYSDFSKDFDDGDVLKAGYSFYFADEDWPSETKIWEYMTHKPHKKDN